MTLNELVARLQELQEQGHGERQVELQVVAGEWNHHGGCWSAEVVDDDVLLS